MARLTPFRALRYDPAKAGSARDLMAPPYDVIGREERARLAARSPNNIVHVDLPAAAEGRTPAAEAARLLSRWREQGILRLDEAASLTWYRQEFDAPGGRRLTRRGFFGRLGLDLAGQGDVLPHERTFVKHVDERRALTQATGVVLSPIFVLYTDPEGSAAAALEAAARGREQVIEGHDGMRHAVSAVTEPGAVELARATIARGPVVIADGHHRTQAARDYAAALGVKAGADDQPAASLMTLFVRAEDPGVLILATHRLVRAGTERVARFLPWLGKHFAVLDVADAAAAAAALTPAAGSFVAVTRAASVLVTAKPGHDPFAAHGLPPALAGADYALVDEAVLGGALGVDVAASAETGSVRYERDAAAAVSAVKSGEADAALLLPPTPVEVVFRVVKAGALLPRKSTYFQPKVPSGLLLDPMLP